MTRDGTDSKDTIANVNSLSDLDKTSCLAELHCQGSDVDLSAIIKVCFGIHIDDKAGRYTLQRFNCYLFAWTILVVTARQAMPEIRSHSIRRGKSSLNRRRSNNIMAIQLKLKPRYRVPSCTLAAIHVAIGALSSLEQLSVSHWQICEPPSCEPCLWKDDVRDSMRDAARGDVTASLLKARTNALSSIRLRMKEFPSPSFLSRARPQIQTAT
ncbi:hypothetical protein BS47DRAFT_1490663 [Hydnum rufescens UP504]|uniref:Uncharacterized protein n=1 Tax=Hydnum rufescens UP504 TaxID=1448309 RepID=A0A9P6DKZ5_9AGAM|nr:hypothetical protein BS47DRAFT_1490663 [Hydnum rufescens UP504]